MLLTYVLMFKAIALKNVNKTSSSKGIVLHSDESKEKYVSTGEIENLYTFR